MNVCCCLNDHRHLIRRYHSHHHYHCRRHHHHPQLRSNPPPHHHYHICIPLLIEVKERSLICLLVCLFVYVDNFVYFMVYSFKLKAICFRIAFSVISKGNVTG